MTVLSDFPRVGETFLGRYEIQSILGTGGFARVYRAVQKDLEREVAIKVMRPSIESDESTEETLAQIANIEKRFRREAKVISKFRSPHTVVVHDYGRTDGGLLYMTLEYVDGETLSHLIKADAPLPPTRVAHMVRQVLRSLHEAHAFDILHRDIKPQNIMIFSHLDQRDLVKVLDFGIAKVMEVEEEAAAVQELTSDGTLVGTPRYMSPEQIRGDQLAASSDIYSLGLVAFEALTATKAVAETTTMRIIARHLDPQPIEFPPGTELGEGMRWIVRKMIAKQPKHRFQSAKEALHALDAWDPREPVVVTPGQPEDGSAADSETDATEITGPGTGEARRPPVPGHDARGHHAAPLGDREPHFPEETEPMQPEELLPELSVEPLSEGERDTPAVQFMEPEADDDDELAFVPPADRPPWLLPTGIVVAVVLLLLGAVVIASGGDDEPGSDDATVETETPVDDEPRDEFAATDDNPGQLAEADDVEEEPAGMQRPDAGLAKQAEDVEEVEEVATSEQEVAEDEGEPAVEEPEPEPDRRSTPRRKKPKKRRFFSVERTK